ncbi:MAG: DUF4406 domain-containing protein [Treponemataceae bacterium]
MTIYLSGPITGIKNNNKHDFFEAQNKIEYYLNGNQLRIINPQNFRAKIISCSSFFEKKEPTWQEYMRHSVMELSTATHILMLDGWKNSRGATIEHNLAKDLEIKIFYEIGKLLNDIK